MVEQNIAARHPFARNSRKPAAAAQRQQHVFHRPGLELVGEIQLVDKQLVAVFVNQPDIARGCDLAGLS